MGADKAVFYAEQGGQVGDAGWIKTDTGTFEVEDTQRLGDSVIHWGKVWEGTIKTGQKATLEVAPIGSTSCAITPRRIL